MARKVQVHLLDDIDGGKADETLKFALDGTNYEIDLSTKHADKLPLVLMYHGDPVRFRNIWIREIRELEPSGSIAG